MTDFGKYFREEEFLCPCGSPQCVKVDMNQAFIGKLHRFREMLGMPVVVLKGGGFRCKAYNAHVGGAPESFHLTGRAADILAPDDHTRYLMLRIAYSIFGGVGINNGSIHLDDRNMAQPRSWTYYDKVHPAA